MKSCFVVNYWADTEEKIDMVVDCIKQLKKTGRDIIYTSLCPIDRRISDLTDFSIFHNKNELISLVDLLDNNNINITSRVSYFTPDFQFFSIPLNWNDVGYSVSRQLKNNFLTLKSLNYTHCHFLVGDCFITDNELDIFSTIEKSCELLNKKAYFDDISEKFDDSFSGIYFYTDLSFFLDNFYVCDNKQEHVFKFSSDDGLLCFEQLLKYNFKDNINNLLLSNNNLDTFGPVSLFKESNIDINKTFNKKTDYHIVPLELIQDVKDISYIFICSREDAHYKIVIDNHDEEHTILTDYFAYHKTTKKEFHLKIYKNGILDYNEIITKKRLERIHSFAFFDKNKRNV